MIFFLLPENSGIKGLHGHAHFSRMSSALNGPAVSKSMVCQRGMHTLWTSRLNLPWVFEQLCPIMLE